jgi:colanic acid/amylovoran biosynthesis glycosyltransferase
MEKTNIAYIMSDYPSFTHTFIRREILALEREGFEITRIAMRGWKGEVRGWKGEVVDPEDVRERERTRYVLERGLLPLVAATLIVAIRKPTRFGAALLLALRFTRRSDRPGIVHFVYLAQTCRLLPWLASDRVLHIHAHFGTHPAEVALFAHMLSGLSYSFTMHGSYEFDRPQYLRLPEKIRSASFVAAVSSFTRSQLFRWVEQAQWSKIKVVHCGVDDDFVNAARPVADDCKRLVCVGRIDKGKGVMLLLGAASILVRTGVRFELVLAGDGDLRADVEKSIVAHGLSGIVRVTGWLSNQQIRDEILGARALVMSSFAEGLPIVIMEAMVLRRPVLATYVGGIPELVRHGQDGWLFPPGSIHDLAAAMRECIDAPASEIARMGAHARERALERHNIKTGAKMLKELFQHTLSRPERVSTLKRDYCSGSGHRGASRPMLASAGSSRQGDGFLQSRCDQPHGALDDGDH